MDRHLRSLILGSINVLIYQVIFNARFVMDVSSLIRLLFHCLRIATATTQQVEPVMQESRDQSHDTDLKR